MKEDWREIVNGWFFRSVPLLASLSLMLLSYIPLGSKIGGNARPDISVICVYFWLIYRPDLFNLFSVFVLAAAADIFTATPFGLNLFALLLMYILVTNTVKYLNGKPFALLWLVFAVFLLLPLLGKWLAASIYYRQFLSVGMLTFAYLTTVTFYPIVCGINAWILNSFLQDEE